MRPLFIGPEQRADIKRVLEFARLPENWFHTVGQEYRGGNREGLHYVCEIPIGFLCFFFFFTRQRIDFRYVSVSIGTPGRLPNRLHVGQIAMEFGFTGWTDGEFPAHWFVDVDTEKGEVHVIQRIGE